MPITISINSGADFEPVSEGVHSAVLAAVVDLGIVPTQFKPQGVHKVQFVYLSDEADEGGRTKYLFERFTASLHEKSRLRPRVERLLSLAGRSLDTTKDFTLDELVGTQISAVIEHNESADGKVWANIMSIQKPNPKALVTIPNDFAFTRKQDRPTPGNSANSTYARNPQVSGRAIAAAVLAPATPTITNDDLPF